MLITDTLFDGVHDKVAIVIDRLRTFEPPEGYYGTFSGGKDSTCIKALAEMAGVKVDWHYNLTTVDPPELIYFIKQSHPDVEILKPKQSMWQLIHKNGLPTRIARFCCRILKEGGGTGRVLITGVRQAESVKRSKRRMVENCMSDPSKRFLHPIIDWTDGDVWEFIRSNNIPYCRLYDEGWKRLGCVMCPNGNMREQAERWPKIADAYKRAVNKYFNDSTPERKERMKEKYGVCSGEDYYRWWITGKGNVGDPDQLIMFE